MNREKAEKMLSGLKNYTMVIHIGSTPMAINYINAKIYVRQAGISFDSFGIIIKDITDDKTEIIIPYTKLINTKLSEFDGVLLTYRYETYYIEIGF